MRKIWISGGLLITGLMLLGKGIDQISSNKENLFTLIGLGLGCLILAIMVLKKKK